MVFNVKHFTILVLICLTFVKVSSNLFFDTELTVLTFLVRNMSMKLLTDHVIIAYCGHSMFYDSIQHTTFSFILCES